VLVATCIIGKAYHTEPMERADYMQWWRSRLRRETCYTTTGLDASDPVGEHAKGRETV